MFMLLKVNLKNLERLKTQIGDGRAIKQFNKDLV